MNVEKCENTADKSVTGTFVWLNGWLDYLDRQRGALIQNA